MCSENSFARCQLIVVVYRTDSSSTLRPGFTRRTQIYKRPKKQGQVHSPGLIPSVPSAGATVTAAQAEREMNVNTRCGAAGSLARVVAMDTLNAADPDTMSATTRPRLTLPPPIPYHSPPSLTLYVTFRRLYHLL